MKLVLASKDLTQYIDVKVEELIDASIKELLASPPPASPPSDGTSDDTSSPGSSGTDTAQSITTAKIKKDLKLADARAMALIAVMVNSDQLGFIATATTAYEQWGNLKRIYEPTGLAQLAALLAAFHGYTLRPGVQVDKVAADLTTIQSDIRLINASEAPTDNAKTVTLTELFLRANARYETTVLMLRSQSDITFEQATLMLKQAEERIQSASGTTRATEIALFAQDQHVKAGKALFTKKVTGRAYSSRNTSAGKPRGKPTGSSKECWHCGSQNHIRTACPEWLGTPEGTKWAAKNPMKHRSKSSMATGLPEGAWTVGNAPSSSVNPKIWLVDSGATSHMTWDRALFTTFTVIEPPIPVTIANGMSIPCRGIGTVELHQDDQTTPSRITIQNVRYMPDLNVNLLSVSKLEDRDIYVASRPGFLDLVRDGKTLATAWRNGGSYVLELGSKNCQRETAFTTKDDAVTWDVLHARLAHVGDQLITQMDGVVDGFSMPKQPSKPREACDPCVLAKQVRIISRTPPEPATKPLGRLYIDGWGPYSVPALGFNDAQYFFTITDEATRKKWVRIVVRRAQFPSEFMQFKAYVELQSGFNIKAIRLDNAGENKTLGDELQQLGIAVEYTTAYTPSQNGIAERLNRTLVQMAKAMLANSKLPQKFWGFAIEAACYLRNRLPIAPRKITPEEAFTSSSNIGMVISNLI
jgi:gag-polypeptide of LTR copia-type